MKSHFVFQLLRECHCWWTRESPRAHAANLYARLRLICSLVRAYFSIIVWVYDNAPIGLSLFWHFLAHLSQRLKWVIVIAHRPSSVRPSVRPSSSTVNFHIFNFFSRTARWILMKLGVHEVLMVPYKCCCFSAKSAHWRIQGGAKIGHKGPLLQETSSSGQNATATNRMHSNDLEACGKKCCYFWFHSDVKFLTRFWRLFRLSHFA